LPVGASFPELPTSWRACSVHFPGVPFVVSVKDSPTKEEANMKYVMLLTRGAWQENGTPDEKAEVFGRIGDWFAK
jgi:hypothetical protein